MNSDLPQIAKAAARVRAVIEESVQRFARKNRYSVGTDLRNVDDFVLVHHDREQLIRWQQQIADFLRAELHLELKSDQRLRPLSDGIDFLGFVVYPTHTKVRRRVVSHCRAKLADWERTHVKNGSPIEDDDAREQLRSVVASYWGHFSHAANFRLKERLLARFPWLISVLIKISGSNQS